jgi:pimeloyl-ACP methyl ester carboxylesterase
VNLPSGAEARATNELGGRAVVCVNGGRRALVPGTWSASLEWLVGRLAPRFPGLGFLEVRYRIKSWQVLPECIQDCREAIEASGADEVALAGFSMGGAVAIAAASHPAVTTVIGLAPWIPARLDVSGLRGRRVAIAHGSFDGFLPGIPGVSPRSSLRGLLRIRALGIDATRTVVRGGVHGLAVRSPGGRLIPLPRAGRFTELVSAELDRFQAAPLDL